MPKEIKGLAVITNALRLSLGVVFLPALARERAFRSVRPHDRTVLPYP